MVPLHPVSRRTVLGAAGLALPVAGLAACSGSQPEADAGDTPPDEITYVTNFGQLGRDAYAYLALEKGFFAEANLDVTIEPGSGTNPNLVALLSGRAQFTVIDMAGVLIAHGNVVEDPDSGETVEAVGFKVLAAIQQQPLAAVMAYDDADIARPLDLEGKRVGLPTGAITGILFDAYAKDAGVDLSRVERVEVAGPDLPNALASGEVDAVGQFVVGRGLMEAAGNGRGVVVLPYSDYMPDLYGVVLVASTALIDSNPDLCARFRDALLRGLAYSLEHPDEAGEALAQHNPEMPVEVAAGEIAAMVTYAQVLESDRVLGHVDETRVGRGIAYIQGIGLRDRGLHPDDVVAWDLVPRPGQD